MDDSEHRENGRHKPPQGQWFMQHQPSMKQIIALMSERDAAIQERNLAISEKKTALAERDMAILQRDSAIADRNNAIMERDSAIATLQYHENAIDDNNNNNNDRTMSLCLPGCQIPRGVKHVHHPQQQLQHHQPHLAVGASHNNNNNNTKHMQITDIGPISPDLSKSRRAKRTKESKPKKSPKPLKKVKPEAEDLNENTVNSQEWRIGPYSGPPRPDWKDQDLGLNQVVFDETTMPAPVCSCTGVLRQCYKWGNGGWQSSCCTTNLSMYPLPAVPNKRHARVGGRKMSGSAFNKLLSRLSGEGHDLSNPVDLKERWAKHGTNRYITIQ